MVVKGGGGDAKPIGHGQVGTLAVAQVGTFATHEMGVLHVYLVKRENHGGGGGDVGGGGGEGGVVGGSGGGLGLSSTKRHLQRRNSGWSVVVGESCCGRAMKMARAEGQGPLVASSISPLPIHPRPTMLQAFTKQSVGKMAPFTRMAVARFSNTVTLSADDKPKVVVADITDSIEWW